ncbi:Plcxd3 protein [Pelomyxa schiedti]|nr:Plcxd3 protein [Pelomyxa schiedti]
MASVTSRADWMGRNRAALAAQQLVSTSLPGTHDSGTATLRETNELAPPYDKVGIFARPTVASWSKTQQYGIFDQLERGVRYLDLRLAWRPLLRSAVVVHGMYGDPLVSVLRDIKAFIAKYQWEIVILDMNHLYDFTSDGHARTVQLIESELGNLLIERTTCSCPHTHIQGGFPGMCMTFGSLWATPHRVLAVYADSSTALSHPQLWPAEVVCSPWPRTTDVKKLLKYLDVQCQTRIFFNAIGAAPHPCPLDSSETTMSSTVEGKSSHQLHVLQGVLTPDTWMVIGAMLQGADVESIEGTPRKVRSLEEMATVLNPSVLLWLKRQGKDAPINIVEMDWFTTEFIDTLIQRNFP